MKAFHFRALIGIFVFSCCVFAQSPTPEPPDKVITEEIKVNISALDRAGNAVTDLQKDDVVISEDGRLHQATSVRLLEPSVLIAMDTGATMLQKKNLDTTRSVASALAGELNSKAQIALLQFHDRAESLADWTVEKRVILDSIYAKTGFGRRSSFTRGIEEAEKILAKAPTQNKHLVLITDGLDTIEYEAARSAAVRKLWQSGVVVHVISYTEMESKAQRPLGGLLQNGQHNPRRIPEQVMEELIYTIPVKKTIARDILKGIYQPRLLSIIIDKPFLRAQKNQSKSLAAAQVQLSVLSEYTGGDFFLPDNLQEMTEQGRQIARNIDSQYMITYTPKRAIKDVEADEIRQIEVTSRRQGVEVRASRKLVIFGTSETK